MPNLESIGSTRKLYNGKLNYGLLVRFLHGQIGNNWDKVYSEIIGRIPTKLLDYKEIIFWFVADKRLEHGAEHIELQKIKPTLVNIPRIT